MNYKWYSVLLLCVFLFTRCNTENEKIIEFNEIQIENRYPFVLVQKEQNDIVKHEIFLINSIAQLNDNPLFYYYPLDVKEELSKCDFEIHSLILAGTSIDNNVLDVKSKFGYHNILSTYIFSQNLLCEYSEDENIYLFVDAICVKRIEDVSKLAYEILSGL